MSTSTTLAASILASVTSANAPTLAAVALFIGAAIVGVAVAASRTTIANPIDLMRRAGVEPPSPRLAEVFATFYASANWLLVLCIGRGGLKSTHITWAAVFGATVTHRTHERAAAPGSRIDYVIVAPTLKQAAEDFRMVITHLEALAPMGVRFVVREGEGEIEIVEPKSRCTPVIRVLADDSNTVRGFAYAELFIDEGAFSSRMRDVVAAILPRMRAQFKHARVFAASTPNGPEGWFFEQVDKPPTGATVVRMASFEANPRLTEAQCREVCRDEHTYEQEILAQRFGFAGEYVLDAMHVNACRDTTIEQRLAKNVPGAFGADFAQTSDGAAIVFVEPRWVSIGDAMPVPHFYVRHIELHQGSKDRPLLARDWSARLAVLSREAGGAKIRCDSRAQPEIQEELRRRHVPHEFVSMAPGAQDPRWRMLIDVVRSRRLHIPNHPELIAQLCKLRAFTLSSGAIKVEGRRDDLADALVLALQGALALPPTGALEQVHSPVYFDGRALHGGEPQWFRNLPDGRRVPSDPPIDSPQFARWAASMLRQGCSTPSIERFREINPTWNPDSEE